MDKVSATSPYDSFLSLTSRSRRSYNWVYENYDVNRGWKKYQGHYHPIRRKKIVSSNGKVRYIYAKKGRGSRKTIWR